MNMIATTRMSSRGQVVIPEEVRNRLNLKEGMEFVVIGDRDAVVLKTIAPPRMSEFTGLLKEARRQAKKAGVKPADIKAAIKAVRSRQK